MALLRLEQTCRGLDLNPVATPTDPIEGIRQTRRDLELHDGGISHGGVAEVLWTCRKMGRAIRAQQR
jgi:hypothetical protein